MIYTRLWRKKKLNIFVRRLHVEEKLQKKGFRIPPPVKPKGSYTNVVQTGNLLYISGHLPFKFHPEQKVLTENVIVGKVGKDLTLEQAQDAAKSCALSIIGTLKEHLGNLDKVSKIVKLNGYVNCSDDFRDQPKVLNGASEFLVEVFGPEIGTHARAALGTNSLPLGAAVEVEAVVQVL
eukprot:TRINITY_DN4222_c0_g1_i1.p1 TRINITY_DN4222_c0_g1~~TRINITY_DN4222_c0_g1_i1.p1  ORF type:complete len:179 (+),score=34.64 TRINITY_DN4222_c0_g1_i1:50-586(+)